MNKYLVITIDVEPDCSPDWKYSNPLTFNGVYEGIKSRLQPLFNKYNVTPTYLINNVVLEDGASINTFKNLEGKFELGAHLHPEFIEPGKTEFDYAGKKGVANCCFYDPKVEFEKIKSITELFVRQFDFQPTSFRAGRFSAGSNTLKSLAKLGYKVDTSVTPNFRWDDRTREKPVDFRGAPLQPYFANADEITKTDDKGAILEVPVSIVPEKMSAIDSLKYIIKNKRFPYKGSRPVWLRPKFSGNEKFRMIVEQITNDYRSSDNVVFNMMFHNVEVMPGLSPYSLNESDCEKYLASLEWFFNYCRENNIQSVNLSSMYDVFQNK
ncbi:MAG: hypothetical protein JNK79_13935 [Chitinophagaceae bacterium]|nr:hypothetical protein [Chitinophagaceae bacterium]